MSEMSMAILSIDAVLQIINDSARAAFKKRRSLQAKGIKEAKKKGIKFGRPRRELPEKFYVEMQRWQDGETTLAESARICGIPVSTFYAKVKETLKGK